MNQSAPQRWILNIAAVVCTLMLLFPPTVQEHHQILGWQFNREYSWIASVLKKGQSEQSGVRQIDYPMLWTQIGIVLVVTTLLWAAAGNRRE